MGRQKAVSDFYEINMKSWSDSRVSTRPDGSNLARKYSKPDRINPEAFEMKRRSSERL
jgi:hypothetical protein